MISAGRNWLSSRNNSNSTEDCTPKLSVILDLPNEPNDFSAIEAMDNDEELAEPPKRRDEKETFAFDLLYTGYSLLADAILTGAASFVSQGWQMYVVAVLLPLASGTGAAAKGTILQMCSPAERADALSAITLIEMVAGLATSKYISYSMYW